MTAENLYANHVAQASKVLAAWFDDTRFRAAWKPELELFVTDQQRAVATVCAAKGPTLDRDGAVYLISRSERWKSLAGDPAEMYAVTEGPVILDPWRALEQLREIAAARALRQRLVEAVAKLDGGETLTDTRTLLDGALTASAIGTGARPRTVREVMSSGLHASLHPDQTQGARTISKALDRATGGLRKRKFWVIGAPSNWGKTSTLVAFWLQLIRDGYRVLVVSGEDEEELFGQRLIAAYTQANALRIRDARMQAHELKNATNAVQDAPDHPAFLDVTGVPAEKVAADIRSLILSEAIDYVFIDYAQVFRLQGRREKESRRDELWTIGRLLKDAVKRAGAGGALFSQITEDEKSGKIKTRDAEDLEHLADVVLFGKSAFEDPLDSAGKKLPRVEKKSFFVKKVKNGPKRFDVPLNWDMESASFVSDYYDGRAVSDLPFDQGDYDA